MFTVCVDLVFRSKYVQFPIILLSPVQHKHQYCIFAAYLHSETQKYTDYNNNAQPTPLEKLAS